MHIWKPSSRTYPLDAQPILHLQYEGGNVSVFRRSAENCFVYYNERNDLGYDEYDKEINVFTSTQEVPELKDALPHLWGNCSPSYMCLEYRSWFHNAYRDYWGDEPGYHPWMIRWTTWFNMRDDESVPS